MSDANENISKTHFRILRELLGPHSKAPAAGHLAAIGEGIANLLEPDFMQNSTSCSSARSRMEFNSEVHGGAKACSASAGLKRGRH